MQMGKKAARTSRSLCPASGTPFPSPSDTGGHHAGLILLSCSSTDFCSIWGDHQLLKGSVPGVPIVPNWFQSTSVILESPPGVSGVKVTLEVWVGIGFH